ncbi:MAG: hypothetical protein GY862_33610, partial [Gammaproteobacteria bacterium]|nr:hypothetical protein [Gammaproteobacteria bacterium]
MDALLTAGSNLSGLGLSEAHRSGTGTGLGTNTWRWSTAGAVDNVPPRPDDRGLSDFPNLAGGTAFITIPGQSSGLAYNAEALADFRTPTVVADVSHRIDNYSRTVSAGTAVHPATGVQASTASFDGAVILHHEDAAAPDARYIYRFDDTAGDAGGIYERAISWQNTRGPTMADGDDYYIAGTEELSTDSDRYDIFYNVPNSIAEVEEVIRAGGQTFAGFYFDSNALPGGAAAITSWFFALFPTMHHAMVRNTDIFKTASSNPAEFLNEMVYGLVNRVKIIDTIDVCGINAACGSEPSREAGAATQVEQEYVFSLDQELSFFDIRFLKSKKSGVDSYGSGIVRLSFHYKYYYPWDGPGLFYAFEVTSDGKPAHWRRMLRGH